ncbi:MAG: Unknown protein, partial [uncultured Sulfurovum sp.]
MLRRVLKNSTFYTRSYENVRTNTKVDKMYYVGIDVAKEKHYVCILGEDGEIAS